MPGRDRTGPSGEGSMTGRRMGDCRQEPGGQGRNRGGAGRRQGRSGRGLGGGQGRGRGQGFGGRWDNAAAQPGAEIGPWSDRMVDRFTSAFRGLKAELEELLHRIEAARSGTSKTD